MKKSQKSGAAGRPEWNGPWNGMGGRPAAPDFCDFCIFAFFLKAHILKVSTSGLLCTTLC